MVKTEFKATLRCAVDSCYNTIDENISETLAAHPERIDEIMRTEAIRKGWLEGPEGALTCCSCIEVDHFRQLDDSEVIKLLKANLERFDGRWYASALVNLLKEETQANVLEKLFSKLDPAGKCPAHEEAIVIRNVIIEQFKDSDKQDLIMGIVSVLRKINKEEEESE